MFSLILVCSMCVSECVCECVYVRSRSLSSPSSFPYHSPFSLSYSFFFFVLFSSLFLFCYLIKMNHTYPLFLSLSLYFTHSLSLSISFSFTIPQIQSFLLMVDSQDIRAQTSNSCWQAKKYCNYNLENSLETCLGCKAKTYRNLCTYILYTYYIPNLNIVRPML